MRESSANSLVLKILPLSYCSPRIIFNFPPNPMIQIDRGGGGGTTKRWIFPFWKMSAAAFAVLFLLCTYSQADALRGTLVHEETLHVAPDADAAKLSQVARGHELIVIDTSRDWTHVQAIMMQPRSDREDDEDSEPKTVSGWLLSKAVVTTNTPNGDKIIFGEAADSEDQASRRRGRRDAAQDAMRLYYRVYDLFPASPIAAEALYRAADIRWQMERSDVMTRPSAREKDAYMRGQMDEEWMKLVNKKYPSTKWADLASFHMIENKLCGDWQGASKCPDKEADTYEKYASDHAQSPAAAEALYDAAWRRSALIEIYKTEANQKKSAESKDRAISLAQKIISQFPQSDWTLRAQRLIFYIQQSVATYGNTSD
jgi:outer membrane protein assembly factor BamD (BamD/ComL family)